MIATLAAIYFCISCRVVSNHLKLINNQIKHLSKSYNTKYKVDQLKFLQSYHTLIGRATESLNKSFGVILFLEILFIFVAFTDTIMRMILWFKENKLAEKLALIFMVGNFSSILALVCFSAEHIRTQVRYIL